MLSVGELFGKHQIIDVIGQGGMGAVYKAVDTNLGRTVALKIIASEFADKAEYLSRFSTEARSAAQINSEHVVRIWEYSPTPPVPYISFEYVQGADLITAAASATLESKIDLLRQVAIGLQAAHTLGVVHRDLKPENILVTSSSCAKILDFGIARMAVEQSVDDQGQILGTLGYMSPEQLSGGAIDNRSDLFSLGIIAYQLLAGCLPYSAEHSAAIVYSILHERPRAPSEANAALPEWIDSLVFRLLEKAPERRFTDARALVEYIDDWQSGRSTPSADLSLARRKSVTVIDLRNLSGDASWDYFAAGFTSDVIREISRRTDLSISVQPASASSEPLAAMFSRYRSDYMITGALMKWQEEIRLTLDIYAEAGNRLVLGKEYRNSASMLFDLLNTAAAEAALALATQAKAQPLEPPRPVTHDVTAYDFFLRGKNYYQSGKPEDFAHAEAMFARAVSLDGNLALAHAGLSDVHATQYMAYLDRRAERLDAARREAEKALAIDPQLPEAHRALGRYHMFIGDYAGAKAMLVRATEVAPKFALAYRTLAWLADMQGNDDEALLWAQRALDLAPADLETLLLIGLIYLDQRKYTLALATFRRTIELGPDYGRAYYNLASVYLKLGVLDKALENFLLAIRFTGDPNSHIDAGYTYILKSDLAKAAVHFQESIRENHLPFLAHYYLGYMAMRGSDAASAQTSFAAALASLEKLQSNDPDNPNLEAYKSLILAARGERDRALSIAAAVYSRTHELGDILWVLARTYALLGDRQSAEKLRKEAIEKHAGPSPREADMDPHFRVR